MLKKSVATNNQYQIRPKQREKFKAAQARQIIRGVFKQKLDSVSATPDYVILSKDIADTVKTRLKEMNKGRYKYIVQAILGQQKGQGVQAGTRCFWDYETDAVAFEQYVSDNIFCLVTVYGVYLY